MRSAPRPSLLLHRVLGFLYLNAYLYRAGPTPSFRAAVHLTTTYLSRLHPATGDKEKAGPGPPFTPPQLPQPRISCGRHV